MVRDLLGSSYVDQFLQFSISIGIIVNASGRDHRETAGKQVFVVSDKVRNIRDVYLTTDGNLGLVSL